MNHQYSQNVQTANRFRVSFVMILIAVSGVVAWSGCRTVPETGRRQFLTMPESREISMGLSAFEEVMAEETPSQNARYKEIVNRVGQRIAAVAGRDDFQWEFRVVQSDQQNAFALPGGKVAIYEGILPICENEAGLAVVMSHEIAHALARHGGERMAHGQLEQGGKNIVGALFKQEDEKTQEIVLTAYGATAKYIGILPYSRKHESEADEIGMRLMAKAGYDPSEAPRFWQRFGKAKGASTTSEFFSTHPSDERRAEDLAARLPEAKAIYERAPEKIGLGEQL